MCIGKRIKCNKELVIFVILGKNGWFFYMLRKKYKLERKFRMLKGNDCFLGYFINVLIGFEYIIMIK